MRTILLFALSLFTWFGLKAEEVKMLSENAQWIYYHNWSFDDVDLYGYSMAGGLAYHTIHNTANYSDKSYYVLYYDEAMFASRQVVRKAVEDDDIINGGVRIREEGGRVYVVYKDYLALCERWNNYYEFNKDYIPYEQTEEGELVLYDFTMQVGDRFGSVEGYEDILVRSIDNMTDRNGVVRKLFTLSNGCKVVEGIGCITPGRMLLNYLNPSPKQNWTKKVYTCLFANGKYDGQGGIQDMTFFQSRTEIKAAEAELTGVPVNEYVDTRTHVVYDYDSAKGTARVRRGRSADTKNFEMENLPVAGCPDASGDITLLGNFSVEGQEYTVTTIGKNAFANCKDITSVVIPETVACIEANAFSNCESLISVSIPRSATSIGDWAFNGCPKLAIIVSLNEEPEPFWESFGVYLYEQATLYVPKGCKEKYESVFGWKRFKNIVETDISSIHNLSSDSNHYYSSFSLFDLQGRRIQGEPQRKGVYIRGGRKYVRP